MSIKDGERVVILSSYFLGAIMFKIKGKLQFVSVNTHYLAALYNADNEVQYSSSGYENKKSMILKMTQSTKIFLKKNTHSA